MIGFEFQAFQSICIDDWKAVILEQVVNKSWEGNAIYIKGMLRLFPEWEQTEYKSPTGELISLTLKYHCMKPVPMAKLELLDKGSIFYVLGNIERNYGSLANPDFKGESKFKINIDDIYLDNKQFFSHISSVAVLITS